MDTTVIEPSIDFTDFAQHEPHVNLTEMTEPTPEQVEHHNETHGVLPEEVQEKVTAAVESYRELSEDEQNEVVAEVAKPGIQLSDQQNEAVARIEDWLKQPRNYEFHLGGYAGTGKTTLIKALLSKLKVRSEVASFTGKAVSVLRKKGIGRARTLHNLLYRPRVDQYGRMVMEPVPYLYDCDLVIVDEASMVSTQLYRDLSAHGKKMLFVGDPAQLEPVGDNPNLVRDCDFVLTEIHRQAQQSPILRLAQAVRKGLEDIPVGTWERDASTLRVFDGADIDENYDAVICGKNATRHRINALRRRQLGFGTGLVDVGETVICLANKKEFGVFNGVTYKVTKVYKDSLGDFTTDATIYADLVDDLGQAYLEVPMRTESFGKDIKREFGKESLFREDIPFDYGYCLTAHKSQGSEWDNVLVIDEPLGQNPNRWRYTAITRAAKSLTYIL